MIKLIQLVFFVNLLFMLTGCPIREMLEIYNNSQGPVIIHTERKSVELESGSKLAITDEDGQITWEDLDWIEDKHKGIYSSFKIDAAGDTTTYYLLFPQLSDGYVEISGGVRIIKIQLEENGKPYFIPTNQAFPLFDKSLMIAL